MPAKAGLFLRKFWAERAETGLIELDIPYKVGRGLGDQWP